MRLLLNRIARKEGYTIGKLFINDSFFSNTLEDKDRGLNNTMPLEEVKKKKVYGETAIPSGVYEVVLSYSPKFSTRAWGKKYGGKVPEILNVKGFAGIRIHPLNTAQDSLGCIGVGKNSVVGKITNSTEYYYRLMDTYILPAVKRKEKITLEIK